MVLWGGSLDAQGGISLLIPKLVPEGPCGCRGRLSRAHSLRVVSPAAQHWPMLPQEPSTLHLFTWLPHFMVVYVII